MNVKLLADATPEDIIDGYALIYGRFKVQPIGESRWWWSRTCWHKALWRKSLPPSCVGAWMMPPTDNFCAPYDFIITHIASLPPHQTSPELEVTTGSSSIAQTDLYVF
jgi:hypothetical protein